jgi:ethanolamine utilization protein EutJ
MNDICLKNVDDYIVKIKESIALDLAFNASGEFKLGVDLGTAYIVLVVLDENDNPVACNLQYAEVVRDGLVVDYFGATQIVQRLKQELEERLSITLNYAAIAVPPGTGVRDADTYRYVVESAGLQVTCIIDEPTAANNVLKIRDGAVVDVGGGTTGVAIFENGKVVYTADEATGGTQFTYVIAGRQKISFDKAEEFKKDKRNEKEIFPIVAPVIQKVSSIIKTHIQGRKVNTIYLVGGTCCLEGFEKVVERETQVKTVKPSNPFLITPAGIAMNCKVGADG